MLLAIALESKLTLCHLYVLLSLLDAITMHEDTRLCILRGNCGEPRPRRDESGPDAPAIITHKEGELDAAFCCESKSDGVKSVSTSF